MGATGLNGAVIGDDCLSGAGALVTEGKTFPAGSLIVGTPARAVRELTPVMIAVLKASAHHYVARQRHFAGALQRIDGTRSNRRSGESGLRRRAAACTREHVGRWRRGNLPQVCRASAG